MRIIAGSLKGRLFESPKLGRTHPMSEKVRGAIFNSLGDVSGLTALDAYAGSGSLGFEAISRGVSAVTAVEIDKQVCKVLKQNVKSLGLETNITVIQSAVKAWSNKNQQARFDLIFCDPPYDAVLASEIGRLAKHLKSGGLLILSWPVHVTIPRLSDYKVVNEKTYAAAHIVYYRNF